MNFKTKILIDRTIGLPLVYTLNVLARVLGFLLRIDHSLNKPIKTIAVCKFVGLGSIIQATPLLQTLRKNYPDASIIFISNESNRALLNHITEIDTVFTISDKGISALLKTTASLLFKLWKQKPDVYIDLEIYSNYSSVIATMSLSKNRIGFFKNDKTYRKGIYTHMLYFNVKSPISQTYLQFARLLGCKNIVSELSINTKNIDDNTSRIIDQKLNTTLQKYIVVNPNASDLRLERRWDLENFATLIHKMCVEFPEYKIILIGAGNETEYVGRLSSQLKAKKNVLDSSGKLSIKELLILTTNASLMITNDTGPMHIAFALKVKTVALFGPCSPQQYGGIENTITIYKNTYCSPCVHEFITPPCKGDNQCMKKIKVEEVLNSVRSQLNSTSSVVNQQSDIDYTSGDSPLGVVLR
ncbi:MAG: glycosyltransferase family 9 protein [Bacteroidetes bacterium]|nr:glycosyltransferase family 9 protein [Bacteroidota bacterium]